MNSFDPTEKKSLEEKCFQDTCPDQIKFGQNSKGEDVYFCALSKFSVSFDFVLGILDRMRTQFGRNEFEKAENMAKSYFENFFEYYDISALSIAEEIRVVMRCPYLGKEILKYGYNLYSLTCSNVMKDQQKNKKR